MKNKKKLIKNLIIFFILFAITYYYILSNFDLKEIGRILSNTNYLLVFIAIIVAGNYIFSESFNYQRILKLLGEKVSYWQCVKYAVVGFFFSSITPAATGGQPVQIYYMHKDNISVSHGTVSMLIQTFTYMSSYAVLGILGYILNYQELSKISYFKYFFYFGILVNLLIVLGTIIAMFSKKTANKLVRICYRIISKFNKEKALLFREKIENKLDEYHDSAKFCIKNKNVIIKNYIFSLIQLLSLHSITYIVYCSLGLTGLSYFKIMLLQATLYLSVSILPLPGTMGVNETAFSIIYTQFISKNLVDSAMLLSRGISFYLYVVITGITLIIIKLCQKDN